MSIPEILANLEREVDSVEMEFFALEEITNYILNEYRISYTPPVSIDRFVSGDLNLFGDQINQLPMMWDIDALYPGIRNYVHYQIIDGPGHEEDVDYIRWVSASILRFLGREPSPPPLENDDFFYGDAMG